MVRNDPEYMRKWYEKNPGKRAEYSKNFRKKHPERVLAAQRAARTPEKSRRHNMKYNHGLTPEQFDAMFESQDKGCAICGVTEAKPWWHVDHCHSTGKIRGILCHYCNVSLGYAKESVSRLENMIVYIRKHNGA